MYVKRNTEARLVNYCSRGKAISITHPECVFVVLVIQYAKHVHCILLSSVACVAAPHFLHYLVKGTTFGGKNIY